MAPLYFHASTSPLSQWHPTRFHSPAHPTITFQTAEQYMMYRKALLFGDTGTAAQILKTSKPGAQKKLGRAVEGFDEKIWDAEKEAIVEEGNWCKFMFAVDEKEGRELRAVLVGSGGRELVEASPRDRIWGIGFPEDTAGANRKDWGQNLLGKALMRVRERIVAEEREKEKKEKERDRKRDRERERERGGEEGEGKGKAKG